VRNNVDAQAALGLNMSNQSRRVSTRITSRWGAIRWSLSLLAICREDRIIRDEILATAAVPAVNDDAGPSPIDF
jgi:hypothetical protein